MKPLKKANDENINLNTIENDRQEEERNLNQLLEDQLKEEKAKLNQLQEEYWKAEENHRKQVESIWDEYTAKGYLSRDITDKKTKQIPRPKKAKAAPMGVAVLKKSPHTIARGRGDVRGLSLRETRQLDTLTAFRQQDPSDRPVSLVSQALTLCPLPFRKPSGDKITLEARLPQGKIMVTLTNIGEESNSSLAYGDDALLLDLLSHEARWKKDPEISFDRAYEFLEFLGLESHGGKNYRTVNERLQRIRDLMIQIKRKGMAVANIRVVDIGSDETPSTQDFDREERGEQRMIPYMIRLSPEYYADLLNYYLAIPTAVIQAFRGCPTEYSLAKWIVYRLDALETETEISLESLHDERGSKDSNYRRFRKKVEVTVLKLQEAWPEVGKALTLTKKGLKMRKPTLPLEAGRPTPLPLA